MRHILTVGVEDFFHADAFGQLIQPRIWSRFERRLERSTRAALDLCDETGAKATFFVLGWIAEVAPELVREIFRVLEEVKVEAGIGERGAGEGS